MMLHPALHRLLRGASVALALLSASVVPVEPASAVEPVASEPLVVVGAAMRTMVLPLSEDLRDDLRWRRWGRAAERLEELDPATLVGAAKADWAFLRAWCLVHDGRGEEATALLPLMAGTNAPRAYTALVEGEVHRATDAHLEALAALDQVPETSVVWPRAAVQRAETLRELGRTKEAFELYETLAAREDPSDGNPQALLALGRHYGAGSEEAYPFLRRLWSHYPYTDEEREARGLLAAYRGSRWEPTWQETAQRAERLMYLGYYSGAISLTGSILSEADDGSMAACQVRYTRGRSYYKLNQLTNAVAGFGDIGERCVEAEGEYGPRGLYLMGTAQFRRKKFESSAAVYRQLTELYAEHSMADDGLTRGGISLQEGEDLAGAQDMWREALERFPEGDTGPEAIWRLAFSLYLEGDAVGAQQVAEKLGALPLSVDPVHVAAGRYWAARWLLYPDVDAPTEPVADAAAREAALEMWADLVSAWPHSFYSVLAWSRLLELDPARAEALARRPDAHDLGDLERPWVVRLSFFEDPAVVDGVALARLGLIREARDEWSRLDEETFTGDEMAWLTELRIASGDWLFAHDDMRDWLKRHPVGTLGPREPQIVRVAYPDRYWDLVQQAATDDRFEARLFHALVREESNFNRTIVSFAGARGLSQLMPATARQTANWLGMRISMNDLNDPKTNLTIGARYLDAMHKDLGDSPYLSLAAYNAGAGRVKQWIGEWGNVPTDEYVERIPFRETREYVKRVMGTWQTMRWQFDAEQPPFYDLSAYNHVALPD